MKAERGKMLEACALPLAWVALIVFFTILRPHDFLSSGNISSILSSQAALVVTALGLLVVLIAGDFDLSVGSVVGLSSMIIALLNVNDGVAIVPAIAIAVACSAVVGVINGFFVVVVGVDSFIVTLGTSTFVEGVVLLISDSNTISGVSQSLVNIVIVKRLFSIPLEFYGALIVAVILWYVLRYVPSGRRLMVVGRSRDVARLSGIHVARMRWGAFVVSSLVAGLAGVLYVGTAGAAAPTGGAELLLPAFAGAFLGATTITPGRLNTWGTVIAVYFLITGITGLELLGAQSYVQDLFYGGALVIAVALSQLVRGARRGAAT